MLFKSFSTLVLVSVALLMGPASALEDYHELNNDQVLQSCAYIANYEDSYRWPLSEHLKPQITITFPKTEGVYDSKTTINTLIISNTDLKKVKLENPPSVKICDETAINKKICTFKEDASDSKLVPLDQLDPEHSFSHLDMVPEDSEKQLFTFDVGTSDIYCVIFRAEGILPDRNLGVIIDWQQSFGRLLVSEYHMLYYNLSLSVAYAFLTAVYGYYIFKKISKDKANAVLNKQTIYQRELIQFKILTFIGGSAAVFFLTFLFYTQLNKLGYHHSSFTLYVIRFFALAVGTLFNIWALYNLMLLATGCFFGFHKDSKRLLFVQVVSGILLLEFLIYDMEQSRIYSLLRGKQYFLTNLMYYELVIVFLICSYWSFQTYKAIKNQIIARKLLTTYALILIVFIFEFGVHGTIVQDYIDKMFVAIVNLTKCSYIMTFVFTAFIALIWRDVRYENNEII